jgi:hypothetical protein
MSCSKKVLASHGKFGCVYECGCGTIHVSVGPVDLKFTRASLLEMYAMLAEAAQELEPRSEGEGQTEDIFFDSSQHLAN